MLHRNTMTASDRKRKALSDELYETTKGQKSGGSAKKQKVAGSAKKQPLGNVKTSQPKAQKVANSAGGSKASGMAVEANDSIRDESSSDSSPSSTSVIYSDESSSDGEVDGDEEIEEIGDNDEEDEELEELEQSSEPTEDQVDEDVAESAAETDEEEPGELFGLTTIEADINAIKKRLIKIASGKQRLSGQSLINWHKVNNPSADFKKVRFVSQEWQDELDEALCESNAAAAKIQRLAVKARKFARRDRR